MMNKNQDTLELKYIHEICKNDQEYKILRSALMETLVLYQWKYQNASERYKCNISNELDAALKIVKTHLKTLGQYTLCDDLTDVFEDTESKYNKKNIVMTAGKYMQKYSINKINPIMIMPTSYGRVYLRAPVGIDETRYKNIFSASMKKAFVEWCEEYPLAEAPTHFDDAFEPPM